MIGETVNERNNKMVLFACLFVCLRERRKERNVSPPIAYVDTSRVVLKVRKITIFARCVNIFPYVHTSSVLLKVFKAWGVEF